MYQVAGISSFGKSCGEYPGVYTRVTYFLAWIENTVWPQESKKLLRRQKGKRRKSVLKLNHRKNNRRYQRSI